jgi:hypothetical protein
VKVIPSDNLKEQNYGFDGNNHGFGIEEGRKVIIVCKLVERL